MRAEAERAVPRRADASQVRTADVDARVWSRSGASRPGASAAQGVPCALRCAMTTQRPRSPGPATADRRTRLRPPSQQRPQRRVVLRARRAALEVRASCRAPRPRHRRRRARARRSGRAPRSTTSQVTSGAAGPSTRARRSRVSSLIASPPSDRSAGPCERELGSELAPGVVQRLVERAARRAEALGEDVDRDVLKRDRDEHRALVGSSARSRSRPATARSSSAVSASTPGPAPRRREARQPSSSSGTSRPCHARRRAFTAASSSANLYAHVVNRLWPR